MKEKYICELSLLMYFDQFQYRHNLENYDPDYDTWRTLQIFSWKIQKLTSSVGFWLAFVFASFKESIFPVRTNIFCDNIVCNKIVKNVSKRVADD